MKSFEWTNPANIGEAVKMLTVSSPGDIDEAPRPITGGQDLLTTMKDYTSRPVRVVNLKNIRGLNKITVNARGLTIGALVTLSELEEHAGVRVRETPITPDKILMGLLNSTVLSRG